MINGQSTGLMLVCGTLLGAAICTDLIWRRIPNYMTVPACLLGFLYHIWHEGFADGFLFSLQGLTTGLAILFIPFFMGGMGGGDVKLLAALGSLAGAAAVFNVFLYGAAAGGVMAFAMIIGRHGLQGAKEVLHGLLIDLGARRKPRVDKRYRGLAYSVPLAFGYAAYLCMGPVV